MAIKFSATPEQMKALEKKEIEKDEYELVNRKRRFVDDFLALGARTSGSGGGSGKSLGKRLMRWQKVSYTDQVPVPADEGEPAMAANMQVYWSSIEKARNNKVISEHATGAEVYVGPADASNSFGHVIAGRLVMQVFSHPPAIYFGADGNLSSVHPETPGWAEMTEFAELLSSQEDVLTSKFKDR